MRRIRLGFMSGGGLPLLLDLYPGADVAYSLRKLRTGYVGNAIRVRRASDNTEQNIGFDGLGNLDTSALTAFCAGTNGFVTTWYDQSGNNRNVIQSSAVSQPQIVSSGSVILEGGFPAVKFDGSNDFLNGGTILNPGGRNIVTFAITKIIGTIGTPYSRTFFGNFQNRWGLYRDSSVLNSQSQFSTGVGGSSSVADTSSLNRIISQEVESGFFNKLFINNSTSATASTLGLSFSNETTLNFLVGSYAQFGGYYLNGTISELIIYQPLVSSPLPNRSAITVEMNNHYSIYP